MVVGLKDSRPLLHCYWLHNYLMHKSLAIIISSLLLLACESKAPNARQAVMDYETGVVQKKPDTVAHGKAKRAGNDDNLRGFDPASEDDLPDNGMSRYMENNDEEGWE